MSTNHRRTLSALLGLVVLLGLLSATGVDEAAAGTALPGRTISWLAAGDSYSAGEGLPHSEGACAQADGSDSVAWAQGAQEALGAAAQITTSRFDFVACSGAVTDNFFQQQDFRPPQWDGSTRYDLITFSFGGNDARFPDVLVGCIFAICPSDADIRRDIERVGGNYQAFLRRVASSASARGGNIVVVGYPELLEDPNQWTGISHLAGICQGIGASDAQRMRGQAGLLNQAIGHAVELVNDEHPNGVTLRFVDVNSGGSSGISRSDAHLFEPSAGSRHNLCSADSWMNGFSTIDAVQTSLGRGSFHPKQAGHDAEAHLVAQVLATQMDWSSTYPSAAPTPSQAPVPTPSSVPSQAPVPEPSPAPVPEPSPAPIPVPSQAPVPMPPLVPSQAPVPVPSTPSSTTPTAVTVYDNWASTTSGLPVCRGNPDRPESMPGGRVAQSFTVGADLLINRAVVNIDPAAEVTATASLLVNGSVAAMTAASAIGDTAFEFGGVPVSAGDSVTLQLDFTASGGKIISVYTVGSPGGQLVVSNSCSDAAATNLDTTTTGLRATVSAVTR